MSGLLGEEDAAAREMASIAAAAATVENASNPPVKDEIRDIIKSWRRMNDRLQDCLRDEAMATGRNLDDMVIVSKDEPSGYDRMTSEQLSKAGS